MDVPSKLKLVNYRRELHLGEPVADAMAAFPKPPKAYPFSDLPPGLDSPFEAKGWELAKDGFGIIGYEGLTALAVRQWEQLDTRLVDDLVQQVKDANKEFEPQMIQTEKATYWMWLDGDYRLLVSISAISKSTSHLVISLGDQSLMDFLDLKPSGRVGSRYLSQSYDPGVDKNMSSGPSDENSATENSATENLANNQEKVH